MRINGSGFAFSETLFALMIVSMAALLVVQSSGANAIVRAQSASKAAAVRLAAELSEWTHLRGLQQLDWTAADPLAEHDSSQLACHDGDCDPVQGARYYLHRWRSRLLRAVPGVRAEICVDQAPGEGSASWACDSAGRAMVLKLGWPRHFGMTDFAPVLVLELGPAD